MGISSCLLGEPVRYDGGHKSNAYLRNILSRYVEFRPFCPEVAIGLGVPRETLGLVDASGVQRIVSNNNQKQDMTEALIQTAQEQKQWQQNICAYVLKSHSPSCGLGGVKIFREGKIAHDGTGIYASSLLQNYPNLPVVEESQLNNKQLRDNFIRQIFVYQRWQTLINDQPSWYALEQFHFRHRLLLINYLPKAYLQLTDMLKNPTKMNLADILSAYEKQLMSTLKILPQAKNLIALLEHLEKYLAAQLSANCRSILGKVIDDYIAGHKLLSAVIQSLYQCLSSIKEGEFLLDYYLYPDPREVALLNTPSWSEENESHHS